MTRPYRFTERGQTLVIALLVSFVLLVLGGVFITVIARNILNVQQARERLRGGLLRRVGAAVRD
jgi:hypothetical protein